MTPLSCELRQLGCELTPREAELVDHVDRTAIEFIDQSTAIDTAVVFRKIDALLDQIRSTNPRVAKLLGQFY